MWTQIEPYLRHFADSPSTVASLLVLGVLAVVAAALAPRRRLLVLLTGLALAAVGGFTLAPANGWTTFDLVPDPWAAIRSALDPSRADLTSWSSADGPANVALFAPLGLALGLLTRRPALAVAAGCLLSLAIESYQAVTGTRVGAAADVVANSLGTLIGAATAAVVLLVSRTTTAALRRA